MSKKAPSDVVSVTPELTALGLCIAAARERAQLTQVDLAKKVGIHVVTLSRIETGKQSMSVASLIRVAKALDVSTSDLLRT